MPFTARDFYDVLAAYNTALWPFALLLWIASVALVVAAVRRAASPHRAIAALLAVHWAWSAIAYHSMFFTRINPAAWVFAGLFLGEAALLLWVGLMRDGLQFSGGRSARHLAAYGLVVFGLAYPLVNLAAGLAFPRVPLFGVPCPTTIFTIGLLLTLDRPRWAVSIIPIAWAAVGASAALLFDVRADLVLLVSGAILAADLIVRSGIGGGQRRLLHAAPRSPA